MLFKKKNKKKIVFFLLPNVGDSNRTSTVQNVVDYVEGKLNVTNRISGAINELEKKVETQKSTLWFLVFSIIVSFNKASGTAVKIKTASKSYLPFFAKTLLKFRYVFLFFVRVGAVVAYFSPFIGLRGVMNHWHAEKTFPLDGKVFSQLNGTYHYWSLTANESKSIDASLIFRSYYKSNGSIVLAPSELYTGIGIGEGFAIFLAVVVAYGIFLFLVKCCLSKEFRKASFGDKFQHIVEVLNMPEAFADWDADLEVTCVRGHWTKWKRVLGEMMLMVGFQTVTNLCMLIPFFVTGM